jgi:hypothetical protein
VTTGLIVIAEKATTSPPSDLTVKTDSYLSAKSTIKFDLGNTEESVTGGVPAAHRGRCFKSSRPSRENYVAAPISEGEENAKRQ